MLDRLLRQLLPGACLMCDGALPPRSDPDLCRHCTVELPWNVDACPRCAEPGACPGMSGSNPESCLSCRRQPPAFSRALAPLRYEGFPRLWVGRLKDRLGMVEGRILGTLLADAAERLYGGDAAPRRPDLLIPVPLSAGRLARRGHNQALTLARPVAQRLGVPLRRCAVIRRDRGRRQRGLGRAERLHNLSGSFAARARWAGSGPCIGIVDDVMTTGATAAELARVLLAAGASDVHVLCATRTPRHDRSAGPEPAYGSCMSGPAVHKPETRR